MSDEDEEGGGGRRAVGAFLRALRRIEPIIVFGPMLAIVGVIASSLGQSTKFRTQEAYWNSVIYLLFVAGFVYISFMVDRLARKRGGLFGSGGGTEDSLGGLEPTMVEQAPTGGPIGLVIHYPVSSIMLVLLTVASYFALRALCSGCGGNGRRSQQQQQRYGDVTTETMTRTGNTQSYTRTNGRGENEGATTPHRWMTQLDHRQLPPVLPAIHWEERKRKKKKKHPKAERRMPKVEEPLWEGGERRELGDRPPRRVIREEELDEDDWYQNPPPQKQHVVRRRRPEEELADDRFEPFNAGDDGRGDVSFVDRLQDGYYEDYFDCEPEDREQIKNSAAARTRKKQCSFSFKDCFDAAAGRGAWDPGEYDYGDFEPRMRMRRRHPALRDPAPYPTSRKFFSSAAGAGPYRRSRARPDPFFSSAPIRAEVCRSRAPSAPAHRKGYNDAGDDGRDYASDPGYQQYGMDQQTTRPSFAQTQENWTIGPTTVNEASEDGVSLPTLQTDDGDQTAYLEGYDFKGRQVPSPGVRNASSPPRSPPPKRGRLGLGSNELKRLQSNPKAPTRMALNNRTMRRKPAESRTDASFQTQLGDNRLPKNRGRQKAIHSALQRQDLSSIHRILQQAPMRSPRTINNDHKVQLPRPPSGNYQAPSQPYNFSVAQETLREAGGYDTGGTQTDDEDTAYDQQQQRRRVPQQFRPPLIVANKKPISHKVRRQVEQRIKAQQQQSNRNRHKNSHHKHVREG